MPFTRETARIAGKKGKRGKSRMSLSMRQFLFEILHENKSKFQYALDDLSSKEFVSVYIKLIPFILSTQKLQNFEVDEISHNELKDLVIDIVRHDEKV